MKLEHSSSAWRALWATLLALAFAFTCAAADAQQKPAPQPPAGHPVVAAKKPAAPARVKLIDINSASREQLKTLPGIGDAEAARIIAGRPYLSKADLATNKVLPTGIYLSIRKLIIAKQAGKPGAKK